MGVAGAATYYVGDGGGWSLSSASWPNGKQFRAGDVLGKSQNLAHILRSDGDGGHGRRTHCAEGF